MTPGASELVCDARREEAYDAHIIGVSLGGAASLGVLIFLAIALRKRMWIPDGGATMGREIGRSFGEAIGAQLQRIVDGQISDGTVLRRIDERTREMHEEMGLDRPRAPARSRPHAHGPRSRRDTLPTHPGEDDEE